MKTHQTTASQLLEIVFENHHVAYEMADGIPVFHAVDSARAAGLVDVHKAIQRHVSPQHLSVRIRPVRSASGTVQNRAVQYLTQSGVLALIMASRKPAARRFRDWLTDEVMPQLLKYGTYLPGSTPAERLTHLHRRWQAERAACITASEATLAESGLMTLKAFRLEHGIPPQDILPIARRLQILAKADGTVPTALTLRGYKNPTHAWPRELLAAAVNSTIPRLF